MHFIGQKGLRAMAGYEHDSSIQLSGGAAEGLSDGLC